MPVTDTHHDLQDRTITIVAEFAAPVERIWAVYADPRQLERVWGPPTHPATFVDHDLTPGGRMTYFMTSPEGEKYYGYWQITAVDEQFTPNPDLPVAPTQTRLEPIDGGTRVTFVSTYPTVEGLQQVLDMGVMEGATSAINQIDALVA